jgi:chemotaxis family two-component system response regulator Rcp1
MSSPAARHESLMTGAMDDKPIEILLVDDNPGDIHLVREGLRDTSVIHRLSVLRDGEGAVAFLRREGAYREAPPPDLILLDLNLPRLDGRAVLQAVRTLPGHRQTPVIILSTSADSRDIEDTYRLGATAFVTKSFDLDAYFASIREIIAAWGVRGRSAPV